MTKGSILIAVVAVGLAVPPPLAVAQDAGDVYGLLGIAAVEDGGSEGNVTSGDPNGPAASSPGFWFAGGIFVGPRFSLEGEGFVGRQTVVEYRQGEAVALKQNRRDRSFGGAIRFHADYKRLHLEPVAGLLVVLTKGRHQAFAVAPASPLRPRRASPPREYSMGTRIGAMAGLDARIGTSSVALIPSIRVLFVPTRDMTITTAGSAAKRSVTTLFPGGFRSTSVRLGVALALGL